MADQVTFETSELNDFLKGIGRDLKDASRAMPVIAESMHAAVQEVFEQQGAVGNKPKWQDLADSTKRQRRGSEPYNILFDTGHLALRMTPNSGNTWAEVFNDLEYLKYHNSDAPRTKIPLRDPFGIDEEEMMAEAVDICLAYFRRNR